MCVAMHWVRLEGKSGRRNNLARLVVCGIKNAAGSFWRLSNSAWVWADDPQGQGSKGCFGGRIGLDAYSGRGVLDGKELQRCAQPFSTWLFCGDKAIAASAGHPASMPSSGRPGRPILLLWCNRQCRTA